MSAFSMLYRFYKNRFFPKISHYRGATRLNLVLEDLALRDIPKMEGSADPIWERQWDNLIILDACRHDLYREVIGKGEKRNSAGSCTKDFLRNFLDSDFDAQEIVYIAGNPHVSDYMLEKLGFTPNPFHKKYRTYDYGWDEEARTILPENVFSDAIDAENRFPDKKKIIHFNQPHIPFYKSDIASKGLTLEAAGKNKNGGEKGLDVWQQAELGYLSSEEIWEAYAENLREVYPYVEELGSKLSGKSIVTSDHGNLVGENGLFNHPCGRREKVLREVPWHVISDRDSSDIQDGSLDGIDF